MNASMITSFSWGGYLFLRQSETVPQTATRSVSCRIALLYRSESPGHRSIFDSISTIGIYTKVNIHFASKNGTGNEHSREHSPFPILARYGTASRSEATEWKAPVLRDPRRATTRVQPTFYEKTITQKVKNPTLSNGIICRRFWS